MSNAIIISSRKGTSLLRSETHFLVFAYHNGLRLPAIHILGNHINFIDALRCIEYDSLSLACLEDIATQLKIYAEALGVNHHLRKIINSYLY